MNISDNRKLNAFSLAVLLVSGHYGLGFLLGTAEKSFTLGAAGSLYAVSVGLGTIAVLALAKFYWNKVEQIWTLLGNRYGRQVKILVGLISWSSLIGIEAVQIIAGAFILKVLGLPILPSMVGLTLLLMVISLLPVEKASWVFQALLGFNILALLYGLWVLHGLPYYLRSPLEFIPSLEQVNPSSLIGISLSTILLVLIDMKQQQFIVQAKDIESLYKGCLLGGILLVLLALLPSAVVVAAQAAGILPNGIDGKETIPFILSWIGGGPHQPLGIFLIISLVVPALGVGSNILRIQTKTILDFDLLPVSHYNRLLVTGVNALLGLGVALKGGSIVNLIVSFYAVYVASVFLPFIVYLLAEKGIYKFGESSVRVCLIMSGVSAVAVLILTLTIPNIVVFGSVELSIMAIGIGFGMLGLLGRHAMEKNLATSEVGEEI